MTSLREDLAPAPSAVPESRVRYKVVGMAVLLAMVTYLDRACISTLAPYIQKDLGLDKTQMGYVFSAFALAYAVFEIPTAWWADRMGTRKVLTRIVVWWSSFTVATAGVYSYASLLVTRFLFGMGEAGAWPSVARTFSRWIPRQERGTIQGVFFTGAHLAGGLTPVLVLLLLQWVHWRAIFVIFGLVGFVWAAAWYWWFRDDPAGHPEVSAAELERITAGRQADSGQHARWEYWRRLFGQRNMLLLCLMYFPNSYAFYFCITWLPTYLQEEHHFTSVWLGIFAGMPLVLSVLSDLFGGVTTDRVAARAGLWFGRCGVGALAYVLAGLAMFVAGVTAQPVLAAVLIALATAASMFTLGAAWGTCLDIGGSHAGVVSAAMNTSGQIGSILSPIIVAYFVGQRADWATPMYLMGGLFLFGAVCWVFIDPRRPVFE
ncbi:MAG: MFS transporter [Pirellulales bacterium]|nr:MFS transporter [Pirellulales bacterium]